MTIRQNLNTYIVEPKRGHRKWKDKHDQREATYANRRHIRSERGKALMRGHQNILKRLLIHAAGFNISLILRKTIGHGTPRGAKGTKDLITLAINTILALLRPLTAPKN